MDLGLSENQQMLKNSAREFLQAECPTTLVRAMEEDPRGFTDDLWSKLTSLGWTGLPFPEKVGGMGGSFLDLAVLLEETGRALLPGPFFSTVVLGGLTVLDAGSEQQKARILKQVSEGKLLLTLAYTEETGAYEPGAVKTTAKRQGAGWVVSGRKVFVPDAHVAEDLLVVARTGEAGPDGKDGLTVFIVPRRRRGVSIVPLKTIASDKQFEVALSEVEVPESAVLGGVGSGWPVVHRALQRAAVAKAAEMVGGADRVLEITVNYAKQRVQFGRPIGSFQAIQHHLANMATEVEGSRYIMYQAAWKVSLGEESEREVAAAKAWVGNSCRKVHALAHQSHGAIGFTKEHDLQLFTRRSKVGEVLYGNAATHYEAVATAIGL